MSVGSLSDFRTAIWDLFQFFRNAKVIGKRVRFGKDSGQGSAGPEEESLIPAHGVAQGASFAADLKLMEADVSRDTCKKPSSSKRAKEVLKEATAGVKGLPLG